MNIFNISSVGTSMRNFYGYNRFIHLQVTCLGYVFSKINLSMFNYLENLSVMSCGLINLKVSINKSRY